MTGMETIKTDVQSQFGKSAASYVTSEIHAKGKDLAKLMEIANLSGKEQVLDVATGGGHVANALAPLTAKVVAFDLTNEILQEAKGFIDKNGHSNVAFVQGDAEQMVLPAHQFDVVTCRIAAHHFPHPERFVSEVFRVLKPNGAFLLIDNVAPEREDFDLFYNKVEKERDHSHHRAWKKTEWFTMLEVAEFEIDETYRFPKTFNYEDWCNRMHLSEEKKVALSAYMLEQTTDFQEKFRIKSENGKVVSFNGESILIKAIKPPFNVV